MFEFFWPFKLPDSVLRVAYWAGARDGAVVAAVALLVLYLFVTHRRGGSES